MIDKTPILHVRLLIPKEPNAVVPRTVRVGLLLLLLLFFLFFYPALVLAYSSGGGTVLGQLYSSVFFSFSSFFLPSLRRRSSQIPLKCAFELRG